MQSGMSGRTAECRPDPGTARRLAGRHLAGRMFFLVGWALLLAMAVAGCAKYNTFFNARKSFNEAEQVREDRLKAGEDISEPTSGQRNLYDGAIKKCQKVLDEYPGSGMTDDALFLMAKSYHRLNSYRMSIRKFDLLFSNFPATHYEEEAIYLQALNFLLIGDVANSNAYLERLNKSYPQSKFQADALRVSGENSFVLEKWEEARDYFLSYLEQYKNADDRDQIILKLAQSNWELEDYEAAAEILSDLIENSQNRQLVFEASQLRVRALGRLERFDEARRLMPGLKLMGETYQAEGQVALIDAEMLVLLGRDDEAASVLENMPEEWLTREVKPRVHDMRARIYFRRWQLDDARAQFAEAVKGITVLEEPEETREQLALLRDYSAAEQSLPDAKPERVSSLKLLQANAMLFGMQRPHMAATRYLEVAADAAADSTTLARGLYGAYIIYNDYLDHPDSAAILAAELQEKYPESPQAFFLREGDRGDLLTYLLDLQDRERLARLVDQEQVEAAQDTLREEIVPEALMIPEAGVADQALSPPDSIPGLTAATAAAAAAAADSVFPDTEEGAGDAATVPDTTGMGGGN